jgi:hypothetical protein
LRRRLLGRRHRRDGSGRLVGVAGFHRGRETEAAGETGDKADTRGGGLEYGLKPGTQLGQLIRLDLSSVAPGWLIAWGDLNRTASRVNSVMSMFSDFLAWHPERLDGARTSLTGRFCGLRHICMVAT